MNRRIYTWIGRSVVFGLVVGVTATRAEIKLFPELSFTVPGLSGRIEQVRFNDIDYDGVPEALVCDGLNLVLFSISGDSVIFSTETGWDTLGWGKVNYLIELGDANRDSVADILYASYLIDWDTCYARTYGCFVRLYDGTSGFSEIDQEHLDGKTGARHIGSMPGISWLKSDDINNDGYNELQLMLDVGSSDGDDFCKWFYTGASPTLKRYFTFPDSLVWSKYIYVPTSVPKAPLEQENYFWLDSYSYSYETISYGNEYWGASFAFPFLLNGDGTGIRDLSPFSPVSCPDSRVSEVEVKNHGFCVENIDEGDTTIEIVHCYSFRQGCYDYDWSTIVDTSTIGIAMYRIHSPDSLELAWKVEGLSSLTVDPVFNPSRLGYFMAMQWRQITEFDGTDGSVSQYTTQLPPGKLRWETPYANEDELRLIAIEDSVISFFRLDVTTDIDEPPQPALPASFVLRQPYPNPFNPQLAIPISMNRKARLTIEIYNLLGRKVATVHDQTVTSGSHIFQWKANAVSSGIYLVKATSDDRTETAKVVLLK